MAAAGDTAIPPAEYQLAWVRSPGPGGQNVNKLATSCQLRFRVGATSLLDGEGCERLRRLAGRRLTLDDEIVIQARRHRTREANLRDALERLGELILAASVRPRVRRKTRPTRGSKERRLAGKKHRQSTKRLRGRPADD